MNPLDYGLPVNFPLELQDSAISTRELGLSSLAWKFKQAVKVINFLSLNGYVILGGDVLNCGSDQIEMTYDNWHYNPDVRKSNVDNIERSKSESLRYLTDHSSRLGDNFCYIIVFKKYI